MAIYCGPNQSQIFIKCLLWEEAAVLAAEAASYKMLLQMLASGYTESNVWCHPYPTCCQESKSSVQKLRLGWQQKPGVLKCIKNN